MKRFLLILILQGFATVRANSQSFTIDDLLTLSSLSSKNVDQFMNKNKFSSRISTQESNLIMTSFFENSKAKKRDTLTKRSVDMYRKNDTIYFVLHTTSLYEYLDGQRRLIKAGFFYDDKKDMSKATSMLYQKRIIAIEAKSEMKDDIFQYTFLLRKKDLPDPATIQHIEDLLSFNSHEYLVSFFGKSNVKKDLYYFSEKELKKCSVLFGNSSRQAVFVWGDENNFCDLSYILVSNVIPTVSAKEFNEIIGINEWELENGIHPGMGIKELLKLNERDFEIYGNQSELAFMAKPENSGKVDFKKTMIILSCTNCNNYRLFNKSAVRAMEVAEENLPMYVYNIIIFPAQ